MADYGIPPKQEMSSSPHPSPYQGVTEANAEHGFVCVRGGALFPAERWFEDGLHVIRSSEFDLLAEDEDPDRAVDVFVESAWELGATLGDLQKRGEATPHEIETLALLSQRFFEAAQAADREQRRRRIQINLRQRGHHAGQWRRQAQRPISTMRSSA